jgi:hypothetical protein
VDRSVSVTVLATDEEAQAVERWLQERQQAQVKEALELHTNGLAWIRVMTFGSGHVRNVLGSFRLDPAGPNEAFLPLGPQGIPACREYDLRRKTIDAAVAGADARDATLAAADLAHAEKEIGYPAAAATVAKAALAYDLRRKTIDAAVASADARDATLVAADLAHAERERHTHDAAVAAKAAKAALALQQLPLGFALEGHPTPAYNGAYRKVSEHKGWPVLRNGAGKFCYHYTPKDKWLLNSEHTPGSSYCTSHIASAEGPLLSGAQTWRCWHIASAEGPLPSDAQTWRCWDDDKLAELVGSGFDKIWVARSLSVTVLTTDAEAAAAERRIQEQIQMEAAKAQLARVQLPLGFALEGHPTPAYNGVYRKVSAREHKGWPVLRNGAGMFCYRYEQEDKWFLRDEHLPNSDACISSIASAEGPLPIGAQTWRVGPAILGTAGWEGRTFTVTVLVCPFPSLMLSASACISSVSLSRPVVCHTQQCQSIHAPPSPMSALAIRLLCCDLLRLLLLLANCTCLAA